MNKTSRGFTVVELLTAVAVLSILLLLMAQMTGMVNRAYGEGLSRVDNFTKSRAMLDLIVTDLRHAVLRPDLPAFQYGGTYSSGSGYSAGTATNAFYTLLPTPSSAAGGRNLSLVCYVIGTPSGVSASDAATNPDKVALWRCDNAAAWGNNAVALFQGDMTTPLAQVVPREMAPGVVGFQFLFRLQDGTVVTAYPQFDPTKPIVSIGVALAVIGEKALAHLSPIQVTSIEGSLSPLPSGTTSAKSYWDGTALAAIFADNSYPKDLPANLRTFERWVDCPSF